MFAFKGIIVILYSSDEKYKYKINRITFLFAMDVSCVSQAHTTTGVLIIHIVIDIAHLKNLELY